MENWLFNRPKERQREKIVHDVFVSGCFGATSCAKNRDSSELQFTRSPFIQRLFHQLRLLELVNRVRPGCGACARRASDVA
jgi:hypothetical protein